MDFYDELAGDYDALTGVADRAPRAQRFLEALTVRFPIKSALDAACGTGMYALLLARMGVETAGADISAGMLDQARANAHQADVSVDWLCAPMQELADRLWRRFDAVLCMGNSVPHLLADADLDAAVGGFVRLLNPGGVVVLQLLNYARILARRERIVGINRLADKEYLRFYDFLGDIIQFNILELAWAGGKAEHRLHTTTLRPYTAEALRQALARHGYRRVELFSGLQFGPFDEGRDETVMLIATKG